MAAHLNTITSFRRHTTVDRSAQHAIRVVVADDIPEMLNAVRKLLQRTGIVEIVGTANNGRLAIEVTDSLRPDLVVMDVNMPIMNGLEAAAEIKSTLPDTKVLVMSADDDIEMGLTVMECGADGFMPKSRLRMCGYHLARLFPNR